MRNSMQDPVWHKEGNCEIHTEQVFNYANIHFSGDNELLLCALFHDLGKPETQTIRARDKNFKGDPLTLPWKEQKISNLYHELKCDRHIDKYFHLFSDVSTNNQKVSEICKNHLRAHLYSNGTMKRPFKRQTFENLKYFKELLQFEECDTNGKY